MSVPGGPMLPGFESLAVPDALSKKLPKSKHPCAGCPLEQSGAKLDPVIPGAPKLVVIGTAPDAGDVRAGAPFSGSDGKAVRAEIKRAGLNPAADVAWLNLSRCRPVNDNVDDAEWSKAEKRCVRGHLTPALAGLAGIPLMVLGKRPLRWATEGDKKTSIGSARGLWLKVNDRQVFAARHPAEHARLTDPAQRELAAGQFRQDVKAAVDRVLGKMTDAPPVETHASPRAGRERLAWLAAHPGPWVFDIETYDAAETPSRRGVATDPFHPDFRVRGVAFAWSADEGCWIDTLDLDGVELLADVFASDADKGAFHGNFDEEGVVEAGLTPRVRARTFDGMLAMVALSDGRHESLKLEKAVVDILSERQYWTVDKGYMRTLLMADVALGAVNDARMTFRLCQELHARLARGEYLY